jgi:hypothetical protein
VTTVEDRPAAAPARDRMQAALLALSDERTAALRRLLAAEQLAAERGRAEGFAAGYAAAERDREADWRAFARPIAHPDAYRRDLAARCLRLAEAGARRDAADHERAFVARAYATAPADRTDAQAAAVLVYAPDFGRQR